MTTWTVLPPPNSGQGWIFNPNWSSGAQPGPVLFSSMTITNSNAVSTTSGVDSYGQIKQQVVGVRINYASNAAGTNNGAFGAANWVTAQTDAYGGAVGVSTATNLGSRDFWGHIGYITLFPGGGIGVAVASEGEIGIATGATANYRVGVSANSQGPVQGSTLDTAFMASTINNVFPTGGGTTTPFQHLMALSSNVYGSGQFPIATTGDFIFSEAAGTVAHFANLGNVTVTGNILSFPNMAIGGNGTAVFGASAAFLPGSAFLPGATGVFITAASSGSTLISSTPNGPIGASGVVVKDSSANNIMFVGAAEASNTGVRMGQTQGNWAELVAQGSANIGLMVGTLTNEPVIIGTNNTARITISGAGATTIPGTINGVTIDNTAWITFTPILTAQTGSPAVAGTASGRYKQFGKTIFAQITVVNSSNVSGASGGLKATLPVTAAANGYTGSSYESNITGKSGGAFITPSAPTLVVSSQADATTWWVNNYILNICIVYEIP